jgi:hypothetical protein
MSLMEMPGTGIAAISMTRPPMPEIATDPTTELGRIVIDLAETEMDSAYTPGAITTVSPMAHASMAD